MVNILNKAFYRGERPDILDVQIESDGFVPGSIRLPVESALDLTPRGGTPQPIPYVEYVITDRYYQDAMGKIAIVEYRKERG